MPEAPRVLVVRSEYMGLWRWECNAHDDEGYRKVGNWTTARNAHDDGREHARHCAALRLAKLTARLEREQQRLLARAKRTREWAQTATQLAAEMKWDAVSEEAYLGHSYLLDIIRECEATDA